MLRRPEVLFPLQVITEHMFINLLLKQNLFMNFLNMAENLYGQLNVNSLLIT